jgi:5-methylcytosine-specific restriction enzyme A
MRGDRECSAVVKRQYRRLSPQTPVKQWYDSPRWKRRARRQFRIEPMCRMCAAQGITMAAEVVDHIVPHRGDWKLFWTGEVQSLCKPHHDSAKRYIEQRGYSNEIGEDGWPTDPQHPVYGGTRTGRVFGKVQATSGPRSSNARPSNPRPNQWPKGQANQR